MTKTEEKKWVEGTVLGRDERLCLGVFHIGEHDFEKAMYWLELSYMQGSLAAGYYIGSCYVYGGYYDKARKIFEEILPQCTSDEVDRQTKRKINEMLFEMGNRTGDRDDG